MPCSILYFHNFRIEKKRVYLPFWVQYIFFIYTASLSQTYMLYIYIRFILWCCVSYKSQDVTIWQMIHFQKWMMNLSFWFFPASTFGTVPINFTLDNVACTETEARLHDCTFYSRHDCGLAEGAGVRCRKGSFFLLFMFWFWELTKFRVNEQYGINFSKAFFLMFFMSRLFPKNCADGGEKFMGRKRLGRQPWMCAWACVW